MHDNTTSSVRQLRFGFQRTNTTMNTFSSISVVLVSLCFLFLSSTQALHLSTDYKWTHSVKLPSGMEVHWVASDPEWITFKMTGPSTGYLAIGFSPSGGMAGSDIMLGWVDDNGNPHIMDFYGTHNGEPIEDPQQDLELLGGSENENGTTIIFRRKWSTCDEKDMEIGEDTMRLIWATSPQDPTMFHHGVKVTYHGRDVLLRGVRSTFMKAPRQQKKFPDEEAVYPKNMYHHDLTVENVVIPKTETYYHCKIVKFPKLDKPHHIIAHKPLIAPDSVPHVHHINIFKCHVPEYFGKSASDIFEKYLGHPGSDCYTSDSPIEWTEYCFEFRIAIAVGSEGDMLPDHLGDAVGDTSGPTYYRLEVHYENPTGRHVVDSSGIRVFYTPKLRKYETAVLFTGHRRTPFLTIPRHQEEFKTYGFCAAECTRNGIPPEGIKLISVLLHAHLTGRKIILRHIRNGIELKPIAFDNHIDFSYQHYRTLEKEVTVLPGDELITECTYDTVANETFVFGGLSTRREMCESFIVYYPKATLIDCRSQPEFYSYFDAVNIKNASGDILTKFNLPFDPNNIPESKRNIALADDSMILEFGRMDEVNPDIFKDVLITSPNDLRNRYVHEYVEKLDWENKQFSKGVSDKWKNGLHYMHCSASGGRKVPSNHIVPYPKYIELEDNSMSQCGSLLKSSSKRAETSHISIIALLTLAFFALFYQK